MQLKHGVNQQIAADALHDVFHKLRPVAFDLFPAAGRPRPHIAHRLAAEFVLAQPRFRIAQGASGRQCDEQHAGTVRKLQVEELNRGLLADGRFHCLIHIPPQADDVRIGAAPGVHQGLQFVFRDAHFQSAHRLQCPDAAAVAQGQFGNLAFLSQVTVHAVLLHRDMEHGGGPGAVDIAAFGEDFLPPGFTGQPRDDAGFDGGEVTDDELLPFRRNECCAKKFAQDVRNGVIEKPDVFIGAATGARHRWLVYDTADSVECLQMILRKIL